MTPLRNAGRCTPGNALHTVDTYLCRISVRSVAACKELVSGDETARAAQFIRQVDRDRSIVAHGIKRWVLSRLTDTPAGDLRFDTLSGGKPILATTSGLHFNLSHSGDWAALAISRGAPVGVDVELPSAIDLRPIHPSVLNGAELASLQQAAEPASMFITFWTQKEAALKTSGHGLTIDLKDVHCTGSFGTTTATCRGRWFHVISQPWHEGTLSVASERAIDNYHVVELNNW